MFDNSMCRAWFAFIVCLIGGSQQIRGNDLLVRDVIDGWQSARESVVQGHVRLIQRELITGDTVFQKEVDQEYWFDHSRHRARLERLEQRILLKDGKRQEDPEACRLRWIRTPEFAASRGNNVISIQRPENPEIEWWDVNIVGFGSYEDLDKSTTVADVADRYRTWIDKGDLRLEPTAVDGIQVLVHEWTHKGLESRTRIWIDVKNGFTPQKSEQRVRLAGRSSDWSTPIRESVVSWREIHGVMLPVSWRIELAALDDEKKQELWRNSLEASLDWQSVNQEFDDAMFAYTSLDDSQEKCHIVDHRSGRKVALQNPHVPDPQRLARLEAVARSSQRQKAEDERESARATRTRWVVALNLVAIAIVALGAGIRHRLASRRSKNSQAGR